MSRDKITLREAARIEARAIKTVGAAAPRTPLAFLMCGVAKTVAPYAGVYLSARIISELAGERNPDRLWFWVITALIVTAVLAILNAALSSYEKYKDELFWVNQTHVYAGKFLGMDFSALDDPRTHDLRSRIGQNANSGGYGLYTASWYLEDIGAGITGIICAAALTAPLFFSAAPNATGALKALNHPLCGAGVVVLLIAAAALAAACSHNAENIFADNVEENNLFNRTFFFFGIVGMSEKKRAMDIRIYNQQKIFREYSSVAGKNGIGRIIGMLDKSNAAGVWYAVSAAISAVFVGCVYAFVCLKAWAGAFGVGQVAQYAGAITALSASVLALLNAVGSVKNNARFLKTTFEFLDIPNKMYMGSLTTEKRNDRNYELEFKDVSFKYPGAEDWTLRHVSVRFRTGGRLAVVGENGSGKTTFIKLLCRLYDPQEGEILLNGIDIRKYNYDDYMKIFSVAFQDFQLLAQPLGDNVAGKRGYGKERVLRALTDAGFGGRLKRAEKGLDTYLYKDYSEDGVEISGGEAQKIAIARALYKDAPFIILDEPTAALDPIAEAEIYEQFGAIAADRTTVCISHRLSSCKFCDEILVFDHGEIIQRGAHGALLENAEGKYAALWNAQSKYYAKEA